jgi:hypothetical protein
MIAAVDSSLKQNSPSQLTATKRKTFRASLGSSSPMGQQVNLIFCGGKNSLKVPRNFLLRTARFHAMDNQSRKKMRTEAVGEKSKSNNGNTLSKNFQ